MPMPNRVPQMAAAKDLTVTVAPAGGINYSRLENRIDDGQLSDALNFWYKDNMLRMRPGLVKQIELDGGQVLDIYPRDASTILIDESGFHHRQTSGRIVVTRNRMYVLWEDGSYDPIPGGYGADLIYPDLGLTWARIIPANTLASAEGLRGQIVLVLTGNGIYRVGMTELTVGDLSGIFIQFGYPSNTLGGASAASNTRLYPYVPTIYTNMTASGAGDRLESRNVLTQAVKCEFFTDGSSTVYHLPDQGIAFVSQVVYDNMNGTTSTFVPDSSGKDTQNGITLTVDAVAGTITFSTALVNASASEAKAPNLVVSYAQGTQNFNPGLILNCTLGAWFGGSHPGQDSGDCLFLSGNSDEPNAVYWSAVQDITYFPADNVDYVGQPSEPIRAFGKVFGSLVIFKQSSVYEKGFAWDATSSKQYFPTSEIRVGVGCDCPESIQLVNNALVWLNSRLGMLVLTTTNTGSSTSNIYTERVIQPLSANINRALLGETLADRQKAVSLDDGRYYYLFVGKSVYLWDYATTPFINYRDTTQLQNRLAWYIWLLPHTVSSTFLRDTTVWVAAEEDSSLYAFDETAALDNGGMWFDAYLVSKSYDFGASNLLKQMYFAAFTLANKDTVSVGLSVIDDQDTSSREEVLDGHDMETVSAVSYWEKSSFTRAIKLEIQRPTEENGSFAVAQIELRAKLGRAA